MTIIEFFVDNILQLFIITVGTCCLVWNEKAWGFATKSVTYIKLHPKTSIFISVFILNLIHYFCTEPLFDSIYAWITSNYQIEKNTNPLVGMSGIFRNIGLVVLAIIALPLAIWRSMVADKTLKQQKKSHDENSKHQTDVQLTTVYTNSIEHLASDKPSIRLAAIHSLRKVAEDSDFYRGVILEILYTFLRENSREILALKEISEAGNSKPEDNEAYEIAQKEHKTKYLESFNKTLELIIEITNKSSNLIIKLDNSMYLHNVTFPIKANLKNAALREANLQGADLQEACLQGADLFRADLQEAKMFKVNMQFSKLHGAKLHGANLTQANLLGGYLHGAKLLGVNLQGTNLIETNLLGAEYNYEKLYGRSPTKFPEGFAPKEHDMIDVSEENGDAK